jgi:hypothetical protein
MGTLVDFVATLLNKDAIEKIIIVFFTAVVTYFSTRSKLRTELTAKYDKELRDRRLKLYEELWPKTEPLGMYASSESFTYKTIAAVSSDLHDWYFKEGGLFLSNKSRTPYFSLKDAIQRVIEDGQPANKPDQPIPDEARQAIVSAAHRLRASLADDIRTRIAPWL